MDGNRNTGLYPEDYADFEAGGAQCGARDADSRLDRLIDAWPDLPEHVRQTIAGIVEQHSPLDGR